MKTYNLTKNLLKKILFILLVIIISASCPANRFILEGKYLTASKKTLKGIDLQLTLQNDNKEIFQYEFQLKNDGSFKVYVPQKGNFVGYFSLLNYPHDLWSEIFISNLNEYYKIDTNVNKKNILDNLYISEFLKINCPKNDDSLRVSDDCCISWEMDPLASYYHLVLVRKKDIKNEKNIFLNAFQLKKNKITLESLLDLPVIISKLDFYQWTSMDTFIRMKGHIEPGTYEIYVKGYIIDNAQKKYIYTSKSQKVTFKITS